MDIIVALTFLTPHSDAGIQSVQVWNLILNDGAGAMRPTSASACVLPDDDELSTSSIQVASCQDGEGKSG